MYERTLFERLAEPNAEQRTDDRIDVSIVLELVMTNLRTVFNTRQGSVLIRDDYGLSDLGDLSLMFRDAMAHIAREIKELIQKFEPRLEDVSVRHVPDQENPLALSFRISGDLIIGDHAETVRFDSELGHDGYVRIRS